MTGFLTGGGSAGTTARWTFTRGGQPITLVGALGQFFAVTLNDNFSGLVSQHFKVEGWIE